MLQKTPNKNLQGLTANAAQVAGILKELANEKRLLIFCALMEKGEANVADLAEMVGLGQSALSQHLARLREQNMVVFRREGAVLFYAVADKKIGALLKTLKSLYC